MELLLQRTCDRKSEKNRVHVDLRTGDVEVARVKAAGGGTSWPTQTETSSACCNPRRRVDPCGSWAAVRPMKQPRTAPQDIPAAATLLTVSGSPIR